MLNQVSQIDLSRPHARVPGRHGPLQERMARIGVLSGQRSSAEAASICQDHILFSCHLLSVSY